MSLSNDHREITIIGAGPAGATTALFLSKFGIPNTIIDAAVFPRDKICGDGLDLKVLRVLRMLDNNIITEMYADPNFVKSYGMSIITKRQRADMTDYKPNDYPAFLTCKRSYFDHFLVKKFDNALTDFKQGTKVKKIIREKTCWRILTEADGSENEFTSSMIIGADGDHSVVLRSLGMRGINREHYAGGIRQYWKGVSGLHPQNPLEIYFSKTLPFGYFWIFPLSADEANTGIGLFSQMVSRENINMKDAFNRIIEKDPLFLDRFKTAVPLEKPKGWGLPLASLARKCYGDGWLLTGDAASLVSPTKGDGIGTAMVSGYMAAYYIRRAFEAKQYEEKMFYNYDKEVTRMLKTEIAMFNFLKKFPSLYNIGFNTLTDVGFMNYYFKKNIVKWKETVEKDILLSI